MDIPEVQNNHASKFLLAWGFLLNRMKGIFVFALTLSVLLYWAYHAIVAVKKRFNKKLKFSTKLKSLIITKTMEQDPLLEHWKWTSRHSFHSYKSHIDEWNLAANYAVQGFSVAGAYNVKPDGLKTGDAKDDANSWTFKLGYAQDNWYVNGWYGEDNTSDKPETTQEDATFFSIAGGVDVDKVNLYALYDQVETPGKMEDSFGTIGAQYNLGSNSRVWIEYVSRDQDTSPNADDNVNIGMRHDF